jgi:hypothetical protein
MARIVLVILTYNSLKPIDSIHIFLLICNFSREQNQAFTRNNVKSILGIMASASISLQYLFFAVSESRSFQSREQNSKDKS